MDINRVNITARLTREPELRTTGNGTNVLNIGVAVNDRHKNAQTGEWEDYPNFLDCKMFGERTAKLAQMLSKGQKVAIEGKLRYSQWEKDGQKRSKVEILMENIEFLSPREPKPEQPKPEPEPEYEEFDIPF